MKKTLISLFILLAVFTLQACQSPTDKQPAKPKNIILLIGDGMGLTEVSAAMVANGGTLNMTDLPVYGFSKTSSASDFITDSGAGGTAISTGYKTYNGAIGVDSDSLPVKSVLEYAEDKGLSTGLISTSSVTHATPASFIAHQKSRNYYEAIAKDFLSTDVDVVIGGGYDNFAHRADSVDLTAQLSKQGYVVAENLDDIDPESDNKFYAFTAPGHNPRVTKGRGDMLPKATELAITVLSRNSTGFFIMIEGSMIDWGGHANDINYITEEAIDFDQAVGKAMDFARANGETLVLVTADHETGGLGINGGNLETGEVVGGFTTSGHTAVMVPVFAYGPGAEIFAGVQENTELFDKMMELLSLNDQ